MVCNFSPVGIVFNGYHRKLARDGARGNTDRKRDVKHQQHLDRVTALYTQGTKAFTRIKPF